jgi:AraC-like DNA-binding protein
MRHLPGVLREQGVRHVDVLDSVGLPADLLDDPDNPIAYPAYGRLLEECARRTGSDLFLLRITDRACLEDFGLAGRSARCGGTAREGLQRFVAHFNLHSSATTIELVETGPFARLVYAIAEPGMGDTGLLQAGAMVVATRILQELCGPGWRPATVCLARRSPPDTRALRRLLGAPLQFDQPESAVHFESRWLDRRLPPLDPQVRRQVEAEVRTRQSETLANLPAMLRLLVRRELLLGRCSMERVARLLGLHRRTLDRHLQVTGCGYRQVLGTVKDEVARQLLRETDLPVHQIAVTLQFSSAANFATAFRGWTGMSPSEYRRCGGPRVSAREGGRTAEPDDLRSPLAEV